MLLLHCNKSASPVPRVYESNRGGKREQIMPVFKEGNSEFSEMAEISRD